MSKFSPDAVRSEIETLVRGLLEAAGETVQVEYDASLADAGITSVDLVNLMLGIEARFDIMIPAKLLTPDHFRSVQSIEKMVLSIVTGDEMSKVA